MIANVSIVFEKPLQLNLIDSFFKLPNKFPLIIFEREYNKKFLLLKTVTN